MKGIVLISHGDMAKGMVHSATLFFGNDIPQLAYCCLQQEDSPESFERELKEKILLADSGEGVILLADLFGGTPCNQALQQLGENVELVAGMNFPLLLELLTGRAGDPADLAEFIEKGRTGLLDAKAVFMSMTGGDEDE